MRLCFLVCATTILYVSTGCTAPDELTDSTVVRDSAGIEVIHNRRPLIPGAAWEVDSIPLVEIGGGDADAGSAFTFIRQAVRSRSGLLAVTDRGSFDVRVFDMGGALRATIGRFGSGPGEFRAEPVIAWAGDDTLVTWDQRQLRLTWFDAAGNVLRERPMAAAVRQLRIPAVGGGSTWRLNGAGYLLSTIGDAPAAGGESMLPAAARPVLFGGVEGEEPLRYGEFRHAPTVNSRRADGMMIGVRQPFAPGLMMALARDSNAVVLTATPEWEVAVYRSDGSLRRLVRADVPRVAVTGEMRADAEARATRSLRLPAGVVRNALDELGVPDSLQAIGDLAWGPAGELLVGRRVLSGSTINTYDIINANGIWEGYVALPANAGRLLDWGPEHVITVQTDEDDVPTLRIYQWRNARAR